MHKAGCAGEFGHANWKRMQAFGPRKRMVHHVLQAYQRVHGQCPQWDFSGRSLRRPVVPVAEALPTIPFPHLDLPKFSEVREKLSEKLRRGIQGYDQKPRAREAFPLEIPPGSPLERKLTQGPGRALLESLEKSWDAEFARAQEPENLAKHVFEDQASRKSFGELIFQEALDLLENLSDSWQKLLMTLSDVPATAAGEAFKATLQRQVADLIERPWPQLQAEWIQFEWEQQLVCRPIQLHVATKMASEEFDKNVLQLNMGEGKSKVILFVPQYHFMAVVYQQWCHAIEKDAISQTSSID